MTTSSATHALWRVRLGSGLRTALSCAIVGFTTMYGPEHLRHVPAFPAFSYVTTILIVSDATLGDTLRGCCHALYATVQVVIPSILCLWLVGPDRFTPGLAAVFVTVMSFVVALPESTPLMAKRIAFGQILIVCVGAVVHGAKTGVFMHPVHVASSTGLGALASVVAMLVPYPRLACYEVKKSCRLYIENASETLNHLVKAFYAQNNAAALDSILEAKSLFKAGAKQLLNIEDKQEGMLWERPQIRLLKHNYIDPGEKLQEIQIPIRGMELAVTSCHSFPVSMINEDSRDVVQSIKSEISLKLEQAKCYDSFDATTAPETKKECIDSYLRLFKPISSTEDVPASFFFYCMELLQNGLPAAPNPKFVVNKTKETRTEESTNSHNQNECKCKLEWIRSNLFLLPSFESLVFALKCSLSLGLAVILGLMYNKENGYWSGLTIAISFTTSRQATFTVANARAQGTAMGSVYGVICCFMFQKLVNFRFLPLLPWIVFTSFLRHSRMYGEAGGISAVIGALLILGRKNYGTPSEFAIARITEASIGLICFVIVEILFQPARAATLAKSQLAQSLHALHDAIQGIVLFADQKIMATPTALREKQKRLKSHIDELEKFIAEAELEPNFWFLPFHGTCYGNMLGTLSKMADLLLFVAYKTELLSQLSERFEISSKEIQAQMNDDLELFKEKVAYPLICFEEVILIKSLAVLDKKLQKRNIPHNIESGRLSTADVHRSLSPDEEEINEILSSFLQHSNEVANKIKINAGDEKHISQTVLLLNGLGFCISSLMRESIKIEKEIKELIKWENPTRNINLYEISRQMNALYMK